MEQKLALIGFGEAASIFSRAAAWEERAHTWDIDETRRIANSEDVACHCSTAAEALAGAQIVLSLVTADAALEAARTYAPMLTKGALWCDMNSVAPGTKREAAQLVETCGGRYVDVAVLAPVNPARLNVPLLVSGIHAEDATIALSVLGFANIREVGGQVGRASAIKMIRSVMVKGLEALTDEMMAAAEAAGVTEEVLASLDASDKQIAWSERAAYNLERMATHGGRRAAEMEESAKTLESLGIEPVMTRGTVRRQRDAAEAAKHNARNAA